MSPGAEAPSLALHKLGSYCWRAWFLSRGWLQYPPSVAARIRIVPSFFQGICKLVHTLPPTWLRWGTEAPGAGRALEKAVALAGRDSGRRGVQIPWKPSPAGSAALCATSFEVAS